MLALYFTFESLFANNRRGLYLYNYSRSFYTSLILGHLHCLMCRNKYIQKVPKTKWDSVWAESLPNRGRCKKLDVVWKF
jgi:hypothetical protein